jgi:type VI secretion system secreted protein VgrG
MSDDKHGPMTLAITDSQMDLHVIRFTGHEALNQPYRFDVDLIVHHPGPDCGHLPGRSAWLAFGTAPWGIHGQIGEARCVHAGDGLSLYRLSLIPDLQRLADTRPARTFNGLTVLQIICRLLADHGLHPPAYRLERITGVYPPRALCVQYQESDLHLLQRLCEEEGISFRFEHSASGHVLVFADDPASFPELMASRAVPIRVDEDGDRPGIRHFAEYWSLRPSYSSHACDPLSFTPKVSGLTAPSTQASARTLERLRCERRVIKGRSNQPGLVTGQIMRVTGHPDRLMNDQWLLTDLRHEGRQLGALKGASAEDIAAVVRAIGAVPHDASPSASLGQSLAHSIGQPGAGYYQNTFAVLPWAMPFRPSLLHPKPGITDTHVATLTLPHAFDAAGRVHLRFDWQSADTDEGGEGCWAMLCSAVELAPTCTAVSVAFFDDDPDQPVVCGVLPPPPDARARPDTLHSPPHEPEALRRLTPNEHLNLTSDHPLTLRTARVVIDLTADSLTISSLNDG